MMEWFRHDVNAHDDIKIKKLLKRHGFSALGVYWFIVELLFSSDGRLEYLDAVDEVCLIDGLSEQDAKTCIDSLISLRLLYTDGSAIGSHRVEAEFVLNEELRQKKIYAGRKGGIAKASNATSRASNATGTHGDAISKASTIQDKTIHNKTNNNLELSYTVVSDNSSSPSVESDSPKTAKKQIDVNKIPELFNEICVSYPKATKLSEKRKQAIRARLNAGYSLEDFKLLFLKAEASDFLKGSNDRNWTATFDWMISDGNIAKILDGNYDNSSKKYRGNRSFTPRDVNGQYDHEQLEELTEL